MAKINIAIDGPVGSGKTTIGRQLAQKLNYQFLDSGLLFRHFAKFYSENSGLSLNNQEAISKSQVIEENEKELGVNSKNQKKIIELCEKWQAQFLTNNTEITNQLEKARGILSSEAIGNLTSQLAVIKELRAIVLHCQRSLTQNKGWVVVGRDITSEVLPKAEIKIFLTASWETRVKRRYQQYQGKANRERIEKDLLARDEKDKKRTISPLRKTADSWELDTTNLSPSESVEKIMKKYASLLEN